MNFFCAIINYISPLIEAFIWYRVMVNMLDKKYSKRYYIITTMLIFIFMLVIQWIFSIPAMDHLRVIGSLMTVTFTFVLNVFLFRNTLFEKFIWWGIYYIGIFIMEMFAIVMVPLLTGLTLMDIQNNESINFCITFFTKIATLLAFELLIRVRKEKLQINRKSYRNLRLLVVFNIVLIFGCVLIYFNLYNAHINVEILVMSFFAVVLITAVVSFALVFRIEKESKKEVETKLKLAQIEMELKQNNDMINCMENLRKLRHDMNNHIGLIRNLINTNKFDELKEYVNQLYEDVDKANEFIISDNKTLTVLLNSKRNKAKKLNIDFQSMIATSDIQMQDKDICTLLGNILDNAIEAAENAGCKKFIDLSIQKTDKNCIIICENSFCQKPMIKKGKFISSKNSSELHGIGTENIKDIVSKYNGEVNFDYDDEVFNVRVVMPI